MTRPLRLVIFDKNAEMVKRIADSLSTDGVVSYCTTDPDEARHLISLLQHDVLLVGVDTLISIPFYPLLEFRQANPNLKIVGISHGQRRDTTVLPRLLKLDAYVCDPVTPEALIVSLPEIADRYLASPTTNTADRNRNGDSRQKRPLLQAIFASG
jgi:DNA-binding response OmpR family regulator